MGQLVVVVGNSGAGKTSLVKALCALGGLQPAFEEHAERPFQALFAQDLRRYGLANQVDYLLLRAEQEQAVREQPGIGIHDGGLDLDFHGFARLFHYKAYLTTAEFDVCRRLHAQLRQHLPPPELVIALQLPAAEARRRFEQRARAVEITTADDLDVLEGFVEDWVATLPPERVLKIDAGHVDLRLPVAVAGIHAAVLERLGWAATQGEPLYT